MAQSMNPQFNPNDPNFQFNPNSTQQSGYPEMNDYNMKNINDTQTPLDYDEGFTNFHLKDNNVRLGFIRKVYLILLYQLSITAAFVVAGVYVPGYREFVANNIWLLVVCLVVYLVTFYTLLYVRSLTRKVPWNHVLLGLFTVCFSYIVSCTTVEYDPKTIMIAALLTVAIVLALTLYACTTKTDFTVCGGLLFVMGMVVIVGSILGLFFRSRAMQVVISSISVVVFPST